MSIVAVASAPTAAVVRTLPSPGRLAETAYVPVGTPRNRYVPSADVTASRRPWRREPESSTRTPGTAAPLSSEIVPTILPVVWETAGIATRNPTPTRRAAMRRTPAGERGAVGARTSPRVSFRANMTPSSAPHKGHGGTD